MLNINLGPFNECIEIVKENCPNIEYSSEKYNECYILSYQNGPVREMDIKPDKSVSCPVFRMGAFVAGGDTHVNRKIIQTAMEIAILDNIFYIHRKLNKEIFLDKIRLPITKLEFSVNDKNKECLGVIELGILIFG